MLAEHGVTTEHATESIYEAKQTIRRVNITNQKTKALFRHYKKELLEHK